MNPRHFIEMPQPISREDLAECDPGIRMYVDVLSWHGVETHQSCEGGDGHCYADPTVDFTGSTSQLWRALAIALEWGLPVLECGIRWHVHEGQPQLPIGFLTFHQKAGADYESPWVAPLPAQEEKE